MREYCQKVYEGYLLLPKRGKVMLGIVLLVLLLITSAKVFGLDLEEVAAEVVVEEGIGLLWAVIGAVASGIGGWWAKHIHFHWKK